MSASDVIKKSVLDSFTVVTTPEGIVNAIIALLIALGLGIIIYFLYKASFKGVVYSESFAVTLIGMCVITTGILLAISSNVILSLGCVGALSIVRYRTAIKSPMDLMFLFLTVGVGVALGSGYIYLAVLLVLITAVFLLIVSKIGITEEVYVLIIHYTGEDISRDVKQILGKNKYKIQSQSFRKKDNEMAVEVRTGSRDMSFVAELKNHEQVTDVTVVQYNGDYIG